MKKILIAFVVLTLALGSSVVLFGGVTDKVEKLIASNQTNFERSYAPRDMRPNQLSIKFGPPLALGLGYSYNLNSVFAIEVGAGSTIPGFTAGMGLTAYLMPTIIAPYLTAGIDYYGNFTQNLIGFNIGAGVDVALDNGFGVNLGIDWVKSISSAGAAFQNLVYNSDSISWFSASGGLNYRFK
ncbi:MAG: hypothetical protein WCJ94_03405 [bacterium]